MIVRLWRTVRATLQAWRERGRVRRQLAAMSERELQDIGASRSEISHELDKPVWRK
ncbi:DUF1127 domain-containing protein [Bradyrhizobium neotropicale]|uniref:DUF1127 domain-containing protein n=1 Tax=Bradyrhizobium neotropicale TaxID=1497615 RepID=UPI0009EF65FD|nr:DUF1127 domain-containing protein [Bradyrhizobium neotropicale]